MSSNNLLSWTLRSSLCLSVLLIVGCQPTPTDIITSTYPDSTLILSPKRAQALATQILGETSTTIADGLELTLWASDSLMSDPIAISIDDHGGIFYTQGNRIANSEFDIRGHRDWMTESISWESVEDRRAFIRKTFTDDSDQAREHLKDLNKDGILNWKDLTVEKEDIWRVSDESGDGIADHAQLYISDFHEEISDLANGVEAFDGDVYVAVGPDLWKTMDTDNDGIADAKISLGHGFAVHIGFGAHGMSGVTVGPDGRIYWGIGDIGMNLVDQDGKRWKYPNRGVIVRCEPDGSNFEVFSHGHRNTHEFVFDKYGNLISEDNDGDHEGEMERLVYIINGSDSGWRINWQFGKYTDPDNNRYKVWMDEKLSVPHWEGQAAYILPPIQNYVNGPTGMVYNPGTALGPEWADHFFIAEFRGTPAASPIHGFTLKPEGAGFALDQTQEIAKGLLPTGLDFGPDGALYFGDWINGWQAKNLGRIWKLDTPNGDQTAIRQEVKQLIQANYSTKSLEDLSNLLGHADMRIRRKAQFELAKRGADGYATLLKVAQESTNQMAKIHALWGMGQQARKNQTKGGDFIPFLNDPDEEVMTQAAKMLGDMRYQDGVSPMVRLVNSDNPRLAMHAAEGIGRIQENNLDGRPTDVGGFNAIVDMLRTNNGKDMWLRAAGMIALGRIGNAEGMAALSNDPSQAVRLAAVVGLRRMESPLIRAFLSDKDELVVTEAARGINDDWSIEAALPDLANTLNDPRFTSEALIRRAINANLRVGNPENLESLINYAKNNQAPAALRAEALATISTWHKPSLHDRVDGRYRGVVERAKEPVIAALQSRLPALFKNTAPEMLSALAKMSGKLTLNSAAGDLYKLVTSNPNESVRADALSALATLDFDKKADAMQYALADQSSAVRANALSLIPESDLSNDAAVQLFEPILAKGSIVEKQSIYASLSKMKGGQVVGILKSSLNKLINNKVEKEVRLDILEAIAQQEDSGLLAELNNYKLAFDESDPLAEYRETLFGGDNRKGSDIFYRNEAAQCVRCHAVFEYGGNAGPGLNGVASRLTKEKLLESLIEPSAHLASGYAIVSLELLDGSTQSGTVIKETKQTLTIRDGEGNSIDIDQIQIKEKIEVPSSMPSVKHILDKKQVRDLVAWLSSLKEEAL